MGTNRNFKQQNIENLRLINIQKSVSGACGFNLTRSKWDPYPWVNAVFVGTPAYVCGLKAGDCILEVNGGDVLGLCLTDIAKLVHAKSESVTLLLWNAACQAKCNDESIFCGPLPKNLTRLSTIVQSILKLIECPICLDTIQPPILQCQNGHLICVNCRIRTINCAICRDHFTPRRAQIAEQLHATITSVFELCHTEDKLRQKLFGCRAYKKQQQQLQQIDDSINNLTRSINKNYMLHATKPSGTYLNTHNSLRKKSISIENLTEKHVAYVWENQIENIFKMKSDKNHLTNSQYKMLEEQQAPVTAANVKSSTGTSKTIKMKKIPTKKYSVSANDLSQPTAPALGQLGPLTLDCLYNEANTRQNVLITTDTPLITVHGAKCVQHGVEMALEEVKSASSSTLSLPIDNTSKCSCSCSCSSSCSIYNTSNKEICFKTKHEFSSTSTTSSTSASATVTTTSMGSQCFSTSSSSSSSGIYTSMDDYQSSTVAAANNEILSRHIHTMDVFSPTAVNTM